MWHSGGLEARGRLVGCGVVAGARGRGYGTRLVEDDARHSRQHLEDETTDRKDVAAETRAPAAWSPEIGYGLPTSHHTPKASLTRLPVQRLQVHKINRVWGGPFGSGGLMKVLCRRCQGATSKTTRPLLAPLRVISSASSLHHAHGRPAGRFRLRANSLASASRPRTSSPAADPAPLQPRGQRGR